MLILQTPQLWGRHSSSSSSLSIFLLVQPCTYILVNFNNICYHLFSLFLPWFNGKSFCLLSSFLRLTTDASFFVLLVESVLSLILLLLLLIFKIHGKVEWLLTKIWNFLTLSAIMFLKSNLALISNCPSSKSC